MNYDDEVYCYYMVYYCIMQSDYEWEVKIISSIHEICWANYWKFSYVWIDPFVFLSILGNINS